MKRTISMIIAVAIMVFMFVVPASAEVETSPVYDVSLAEYTAPVEITAVSEIAEGESILKNDIEGDITITSGEYVIDLNGYTWVGRLLIEGGNVTVKDTSAEKTGKIDASLRADAIDVSGGAIVSLENITVIGAFGSGDGIFVSGSANVTVKNCVLTAGKVGVDIISLSAVVIVEDSVFADFADYVTDKEKDERNAAIEFRNNAQIILRGDNKFEVNKVICRTADHTISFENSFVLGENVTATFTEDVDMGVHAEYEYKSTAIAYSFVETEADSENKPIDETTDKSTDESADNTTDNSQESDKSEISNPNTGDFVSFVIIVATVAFAATVLSKKRAF